MKCNFDKEKLNAYVDNELDEATTKEVQEHISSCQECMQFVEEIKSLVGYIKEIPFEKAPEQIKSKVMAKISESKKGVFEKYLLVIRLSLATAAAILVILSVIYLVDLAKIREKPKDVAVKPPEVEKPTVPKYKVGEIKLEKEKKLTPEKMKEGLKQARPPLAFELKKGLGLAQKKAKIPPSDVKEYCQIDVYVDNLPSANYYLNSFVTRANVPKYKQLHPQVVKDAISKKYRYKFETPEEELKKLEELKPTTTTWILYCTEDVYNMLVSEMEDKRWHVVPQKLRKLYKIEKEITRYRAKLTKALKVDRAYLRKVEIILKEVKEESIPAKTQQLLEKK